MSFRFCQTYVQLSLYNVSGIISYRDWYQMVKKWLWKSYHWIQDKGSKNSLTRWNCYWKLSTRIWSCCWVVVQKDLRRCLSMNIFQTGVLTIFFLVKKNLQLISNFVSRVYTDIGKIVSLGVKVKVTNLFCQIKRSLHPWIGWDDIG